MQSKFARSAFGTCVYSKCSSLTYAFTFCIRCNRLSDVWETVCVASPRWVRSLGCCLLVWRPWQWNVKGDDALSHEIASWCVSLWKWEIRWGEKRSFGEREAGPLTLRFVTPDLSREHPSSSSVFTRVAWPRFLWAAALSVPKILRPRSGPVGWWRGYFMYALFFLFLSLFVSV